MVKCADVEGNGYPLESYPPRGGRSIIIKSKDQAEFFKKILSQRAASIIRVVAKSIDAKAVGNFAQDQTTKITGSGNDVNSEINKSDRLSAILDLGAIWATSVVNGTAIDPNITEALKQTKRILPYGRTFNGVRTEHQAFRIELNEQKISLLYPQAGNLKILFGIKASDELIQAALANSFALFTPNSLSREFMQLVSLIVSADIEVEEATGNRAIPSEQVPFNREVQLFSGQRLVTNLELNRNLSA